MQRETREAAGNLDDYKKSSKKAGLKPHIFTKEIHNGGCEYYKLMVAMG